MNRKWIALCIALSLVRISFASEPTEPTKGKGEGDDKAIFPDKKKTNLISNPGFENKTSHWVLGKINGGAGQFTTDTVKAISGRRSAVVHTLNKDREMKDLALFTFIPLEKGVSYTFSFQADPKKACLISVSFDNGDDFYFMEEIWLRPGLRTYGPYTFTAIDDDIFNRLSFNLGKTNTEIRLDEVYVNSEYTEKQIEEPLTNNGIHLEYLRDTEFNSIHVSIPEKPGQDIPLLIYDENNNVIYADKISKQSNEATIALKRNLHIGDYRLDVYLTSRKESIDLHLE